MEKQNHPPIDKPIKLDWKDWLFIGFCVSLMTIIGVFITIMIWSW